jgi:CheY-like chemotaxis protein
MDAVGQLAGGIAHDFNNLLTAICGYSSFALSRLAPGDPARGDIEEVMNAGERAATLTRQLLAFSRKQVLAPRPLDLNAVLKASQQMLQRLIGENIELSVTYGSELGLVLADPGQIDQVVLNLAVNARDAMPRGGKLSIDTSNVELDEHYAREQVGARAGPYVRIRVSDAGVGMSEEVRLRIFEPFFTTKAPGKGTGLGLSTVYGIVRQSGGHITVSSVEGKGTTFSVYLPRTNAHALPAGPSWAGGLPKSRGMETILLVEDERPVRKLAHQILTSLGYKVLVACDGVEALEVEAQYDAPIHLLLSDVVMPRMSGGELARRLVERRPSIRVLFFSGYAADAGLHPSVPVGELSLIQKPFTSGVLARRTREALDREQDNSSPGAPPHELR